MQLSSDWWQGFWIGIAVIVLTLIPFVIAGMSNTSVLQYPREAKECVVRAYEIQHCYHKEAE